MIKAETINQFEGFGPDAQKLSLGEYHRSDKMRKGLEGAIADTYAYNVFSTSDYAGINSINSLTKGRGRGYSAFTEVEGDYMFAGDGGNNQIYQSYLGIFSWENVYRVLGQNWFGAGLGTDQKKRLLYPGWRYLGMHDPTVANYTTGTVQVTNGSTAVVGTGTTFAAGDVGKVFRINAENNFYLITGFTDATHIAITTYTGTSGSGKSYFIYRGWTDQWKDFGTEISSVDIPIETYEDTVLFGRANNICSLNTLTDTITTDAAPAFNMPAGYTCVGISANTNGILMGFNFQGRGVLVLWDNYSDRSIAPWIRLDDRISQMTKTADGWVVVTSKAILKTNGYSVEVLVDNYLDSATSAFGGGTSRNCLVFGNTMYFYNSYSGRGKRRAGLYIMNLTTRECEFVPVASGNQFSGSIAALFYSPDFTTFYTASSRSIQALGIGGMISSLYCHLTTNPVGQGENMKYAEAIKLPIGIGKAYSQINRAKSFSIQAKISNLDRQLYSSIQVKTTAVELNKITVDESVYVAAQVGDEIEFLDSVNAGTAFNILSITGSGTATAVYTLDRNMPNLAISGDNCIRSTFKLIETKTFTNFETVPQIYFNIKNRYKGRKFLIKFTIFGATLPIELKPFDFVYDDSGIIE